MKLPRYHWQDPAMARFVPLVETALDAPMRECTVATQPEPSRNRGQWIIVTDESGGETPAWCDGTNWRRMSDNAVIT